MKNQNQKPVLHLRVYNNYGNSSDLAYDRAGKVLNPNQIIKMQHNTLEFANLLKNLKFLGFVKYEVERVTVLNDELEWVDSDEPKGKYQHEVNVAFYGEKKAEEMKSELDFGQHTLKKGPEPSDTGSLDGGVDTLTAARERYKDVFDKPAYHGWSVEQIEEKIKEKLNS